MAQLLVGMARFDIYRNAGAHAATTPFLVDVQSEHVSGLATRVVIPLRLVDRFPPVRLPRDLMPVFRIEDQACFLDTPKLAAVPRRELGQTLGSLQDQQDSIIAALDRLFGAF
jgi:toxin CcdB